MFIRKKNSQGVYVLILKVYYSISIKTSRFTWLLNPGLYLYFGSAKGKTSTSLNNSIIRHYNQQKQIFWHIDHLTTNSKSKLLNSYYTTDPNITECKTLQEIIQKFQEMKVISQFGSSDCKSSCGGHLLFISSNQGIFTDITKYIRQKGWNEFKVESIF